MNDETVKIRDLSATGEGVAESGNGILFVDGALPGEEVIATVVKRQKNYSKGVLKQIITASSDRVHPPCEYFGSCGGCQLQHANTSFQQQRKRNKVYQALTRIGQIENPNVETCIASEKDYGYRNKVTVPLLEVSGAKKMGFFKKRSHEIVSINSCKLHIPFADVVYQRVREILLSSSVSFYSEERRKGILQHLVIRTSISENKVLIGLIGLTKCTEAIKDIAEEIYLISGVKGVVYGRKNRASNSIYPDHQEVLRGKGELTELILGFSMKISLLSFFQVNKWCAEKLYKKAFDLANLESGKRVLDAYAGIGTFGIYLAKKGLDVTAIESFPKAVDDGKVNARRNGVEIKYIEGEVEKKVSALKDFDCIFINPPRKGIHEDVVNAIGVISPNKVVYTSCDPATLARDIKRFEDKGYTFIQATPFDMFPQTMHVETVALLEKKHC